ncbi:MAG: Nif3-like dinuclear metal center hexameric protein [Desulfobacterales bacterium]|nr:MAG: Nif3-like dinuclear metal center hexameric protein [Desulfobacterales bacterium]
MLATIADIVEIMETVAPIRLAEQWDNVGLQLGQKDWPVRRIWVALDPTFEVIQEACQSGVDLLITHHPLISEPLRSIDFKTPIGSVIKMAIQHHLAIYVAHTNLDSAVEGLNDFLARQIGLEDLKALRHAKPADIYKLVVYVPKEHEQQLLHTLFETAAGEIGPYTCCTFRNSGTGTFRPGSSSKPYSGQIDEISSANEIRLESVVRKDDINNIVRHLRAIHPYETMAYDIYPLKGPGNREGLGRVGSLNKSTDLISYAKTIKERLRLNSIKIAGRSDLIVKTAAVCSGSGSGLMDDFLSSGAEVYISGDLKFHDARAVEAADLGLIDIGHFASEHLMVEMLVGRLKKILSQKDIDINIEACELENDPFIRL